MLIAPLEIKTAPPSPLLVGEKWESPFQGDKEKTSILPVATLVLWLGCLTIGLLGFVMAYARPHPAKPADLVKVEMLNVELTDEPLPDLQPPSNLSSSSDPQPQIPQPAAVAQPSPAIAFALPVKGPVQIVAARDASYSRGIKPVVATPVPQRLDFGRGEGRQPQPPYPQRARREGQEGTVVVRFTVSESGKVITADAITPSSSPLLDEAALSTIRERWRFSPGAVRAYEVAIRFQLRD